MYALLLLNGSSRATGMSHNRRERTVSYRPEAAVRLDRMDFHKADIPSNGRRTEVIGSELPQRLIWELQFPLDRLEARLLAQWIE
jgi:hypothetical protein